jgi:hypothetical protein
MFQKGLAQLSAGRSIGSKSKTLLAQSGRGLVPQSEPPVFVTPECLG